MPKTKYCESEYNHMKFNKTNFFFLIYETEHINDSWNIKHETNIIISTQIVKETQNNKFDKLHNNHMRKINVFETRIKHPENRAT